MFRLSQDIGIDLGTANVLVYVRGKGIIMREPSVVAVYIPTRKIKEVGEKAREMLGRTPVNIAAVRPMVDGVIADYTTTQQMLEYIFHKVCGAKRVFKPRVLIAVPSGVTSVEKRAVKQAALAAGAREAWTIEEAKAAAIGAGLPIKEPGGNMVVDIGGGTTDIAVLSLDGIVLSRSIRIGGMKLDEVIMRHVRTQYNLAIGDRTAEEIKITIGSATNLEQEIGMEVRGRDLISGLPQTIEVSSQEIRECMVEPISQIVSRVKNVLEKTPPELASDIIERGIILTGGTAMLRGLDRLIAEATQVPTRVANDPLSCVAIGTGKYLEEHRDVPEEFHYAA
ncbi:rod shape-determining protein [Capsulimonas corticalis]|uniref:Cell shape-determining protein MreB n=1 Tax=Capsulimonas corticalis TaxID=2219043 RepID=A0A402D3G7_9BACT|nr:rod shape-determining protein [Capsulimonas corticalis]BDI31891.1 rod shape-determining protein [Capsulimonas corticalis]